MESTRRFQPREGKSEWQREKGKERDPDGQRALERQNRGELANEGKGARAFHYVLKHFAIAKRETNPSQRCEDRKRVRNVRPREAAWLGWRRL